MPYHLLCQTRPGWLHTRSLQQLLAVVVAAHVSLKASQTSQACEVTDYRGLSRYRPLDANCRTRSLRAKCQSRTCDCDVPADSSKGLEMERLIAETGKATTTSRMCQWRRTSLHALRAAPARQ